MKRLPGLLALSGIILNYLITYNDLALRHENTIQRWSLKKMKRPCDNGVKFC